MDRQTYFRSGTVPVLFQTEVRQLTQSNVMIIDEFSLNPLSGFLERWFRISSCTAAIVVWFLVQPPEPDDEADNTRTFPGDLLVFFGRLVFAVFSLVCMLWVVVTFIETTRLLFQLDFGHAWMNWPWWITLPFWFPVPFIYYFYLLGCEMITPMLWKR